MKITFSSSVYEFNDIGTLDDIRIHSPMSKVFETYSCSELIDDVFYLRKGNIHNIKKKYNLTVDNLLWDSKGEQYITLKWKVMFVLISSKGGTSRIIATDKGFVFEETMKNELFKQLKTMELKDPNLYEQLIVTLGNRRMIGNRTERDLRMLTDFFFTSNSYVEKIEDIILKYNTFRDIIFLETML